MLRFKNKFNKRMVLLGVIFVISLVSPLASFADTEPVKSNSDLYESAWTEGLKPGERVVEVYNEPCISQVNDSNVYLDSDRIAPREASLRWFAVSSTYVGNVGGEWQYAGASTISGGVLTASHSSSISNRYTGTLTVTKKVLSSLVGFDVTYTGTASVGYHTNPYPKLKNKGHRLEYRHIYKKFEVKQEKKYDRRASKSYGTEYVYPQEWAERQYRVVEFDI